MQFFLSNVSRLFLFFFAFFDDSGSSCDGPRSFLWRLIGSRLGRSTSVVLECISLKTKFNFSMSAQYWKQKKFFSMCHSWTGQEIMSFSSYRNTHCCSHEEDNLMDVVLTYCRTFIGIENSSSSKSTKNINVVSKITQRITVASNDFAHK